MPSSNSGIPAGCPVLKLSLPRDGIRSHRVKMQSHRPDPLPDTISEASLKSSESQMSITRASDPLL